VFEGILIADGVGNKGSGNTVTIHVQAHLEVFFNMSLRSTCFADKLLSSKKQNNLS